MFMHPLDLGRLVTKLTKISLQLQIGIGSGFSRPWYFSQEAFAF
jgi:hypothetical protein